MCRSQVRWLLPTRALAQMSKMPRLQNRRWKQKSSSVEKNVWELKTAPQNACPMILVSLWLAPIAGAKWLRVGKSIVGCPAWARRRARVVGSVLQKVVAMKGLRPARGFEANPILGLTCLNWSLIMACRVMMSSFWGRRASSNTSSQARNILKSGKLS